MITVERRADESISKAKNRERVSTEDDYKFPPVDLLDSPSSSNRHVDKDLLENNAAVLEQKLADLGVQGEVVAVHPGPVITMYELNLAPGVPLRKIINTSDDLAMALKSGSTRVVAPIHGKDTVGIEVPNLNREIVYFREIIESPAFEELGDPLKMAVGKGIDGKPFSTSLARMPHLLIAGATGTGKSVGLNSLICSWLMYCHPDDLKLLLVDPKKLELSYYQDIPHLLHPVVTEPEKVPKVLSWAIREMERRYTLLSQTGAKNVESYNKKVRSGEIVGTEDGPAPEKLPYIVIIVDELAELMMVAAKDIEISIARLGSDGSSFRNPPDSGDAAAFRGCYHRRDQGEFPGPNVVSGFSEAGFQDNSRHDRRGTSARDGRHAFHAAGRLQAHKITRRVLVGKRNQADMRFHQGPARPGLPPGDHQARVGR